MAQIKHFAIIENAGYVGEKDIGGRFATYTEASKRLHKQYDADEIESMHVDIAGVLADGSLTFDF